MMKNRKKTKNTKEANKRAETSDREDDKEQKTANQEKESSKGRVLNVFFLRSRKLVESRNRATKDLDQIKQI